MLIGTTVLEVGVDVPDATAMIVLDADRFGIAQRGRLRGRVGRGQAQSGCVLGLGRLPRPRDASRGSRRRRLAGATAPRRAGEEHRRLRSAELDLDLRGEGDLLRLAQSGLPPLRVADLGSRSDRALSLEARRLAEQVVDASGRLPERFAAFQAELTHGWLVRVGAGDVVAGDGLHG